MKVTWGRMWVDYICRLQRMSLIKTTGMVQGIYLGPGQQELRNRKDETPRCLFFIIIYLNVDSVLLEVGFPEE